MSRTAINHNLTKSCGQVAGLYANCSAHNAPREVRSSGAESRAGSLSRVMATRIRLTTLKDNLNVGPLTGSAVNRRAVPNAGLPAMGAYVLAY